MQRLAIDAALALALCVVGGAACALGSNAQGSDATGGPADAPAKTLLPGEDTGFDPPADGAARRAAALGV